MLLMLVTSGIIDLGRVGVVWVVCRIWGYVNCCIVGVVKVLGGDSVSVVFGSLVVIGHVRAVVSVGVVGGGFGKGLRYRRGVGIGAGGSGGSSRLYLW